MNAKEFLDKHGWDEARQVAEAAKTTPAYFSQIVYGHRTPSRALAKRLAVASDGRMTAVELLGLSEQSAA